MKKQGKGTLNRQVPDRGEEESYRERRAEGREK